MLIADALSRAQLKTPISTDDRETVQYKLKCMYYFTTLI